MTNQVKPVELDKRVAAILEDLAEEMDTAANHAIAAVRERFWADQEALRAVANIFPNPDGPLTAEDDDDDAYFPISSALRALLQTTVLVMEGGLVQDVYGLGGAKLYGWPKVICIDYDADDGGDIEDAVEIQCEHRNKYAWVNDRLILSPRELSAGEREAVASLLDLET